MNVSSERTAAIVYSNIVDVTEIRKNYIYDLVDQAKFSYKSESSTEIEMTHSPGSLAKYSPPIVAYYFVPSADINNYNDMIVVYD